MPPPMPCCCWREAMIELIPPMADDPKMASEIGSISVLQPRSTVYSYPNCSEMNTPLAIHRNICVFPLASEYAPFVPKASITPPTKG